MNANLYWQMFCRGWTSEETHNLSYCVENSATRFVHVPLKVATDCIHDNTSRKSYLFLETHCWMRPEAGRVEKHICWICQEESSSEALLFDHYKDHLTND